MKSLRASLEGQLSKLGAMDEKGLVAEAGSRKEASMQAVAQQLVPQMNEVQRQHDEQEAELERRKGAAADAASRGAVEQEQRDKQKLHDLAL